MSTTNFIICANRLALDFVNTEILADGQPADLLTTYQDLVAWAQQAGAMDAGEVAFVMERWSNGPEADEALATARSLRAALTTAADRLIAHQPIPAESIETINQALRSRPGYLQVEPAGAEWAARWKVPLRRADDVLWRVARSAASLLADDDLTLIKRCERSRCGLYFYDNTRNRTKRWCRMEVCGAAERAAAYYRRRRQ